MARKYLCPAAADLSQSVTIQRLVSTPDGAGGQQTAWAARGGLTAIHAKIAPVSGLERMVAQGLAAVGTFLITVRYSSATASITEADRVLNTRTGKLYNIRFVSNPDERNMFIELVCESGVAS